MFNDKLVVNESESEAGCYFRIPPQGRSEEAKGQGRHFSPDLNIVTYAFGSELSHVTCDATRLL